MARVLHIEDDPRNRRLVSKLLSVAGHEVIDAETGLEGIRLANEHRAYACSLVLEHDSAGRGLSGNETSDISPPWCG